MTLDRVIGLVAMAFFAGFLGIIVFSVPRPALIVVAVIVLALAIRDFWAQLAGRRR